jgi:hypothetical protein
MGSFPIADMSRPGRGIRSYPAHFRWDLGLAHSLSWPRHLDVGIMDPCPLPHVCMGWRDQRQNFNSLSKMPHVFKIKISVFQVMTAKRQKDSLPEFCYGFNKEFGFFFSSLGPLPKIKS